ncbi:MAG: hypothetical protein ABI759_00625 [Candidatus Solibacter sp.]
MKSLTAVAVVICGSLHCLSAQEANPALLREADAVRLVLALHKARLSAYSWTEHIEVRVKEDLRTTSEFFCRYNSKGEVVRTAKPGPDDQKHAKRRKNSKTDDYIERAISLIRNYLPPDPDRIEAMLLNGTASLGPTESGKSAIRFERYFMAGDVMTFQYDPVSKVLLHVSITATLGKKKDPVTLQAEFEPLPDKTVHMTSSLLDAKKQNVQVKTTNIEYQKIGD